MKGESMIAEILLESGNQGKLSGWEAGQMNDGLSLSREKERAGSS